jgi:hypothetical protein
MIIISLILGIIFIYDLFKGFLKPEKKFFTLKVFIFSILNLIFWINISIEYFNFYFPNYGISKVNKIEITNNINDFFEIEIFELKDNSLKKYYFNFFNLKRPNDLLNKINLNYKEKFTFNTDTSSKFFLIKSKNSNAETSFLSFKKINYNYKFYLNDFEKNNYNFKKNINYELNILISSFVALIGSIYFLIKIKTKLIIKLFTIIIFLFYTVLSSYNLYILIRIIGEL